METLVDVWMVVAIDRPWIQNVEKKTTQDFSSKNLVAFMGSFLLSFNEVRFNFCHWNFGHLKGRISKIIMHLIGPPEGSFEGPSIYPFQEMNDDFDTWIL